MLEAVTERALIERKEVAELLRYAIAFEQSA